ncbi:hypothetical protein NDR87_13995 [Nocardia sp. CDC159]|uniref:Aminoacyl-transfer RNA synthetases class-II family profile domain-containing protein n=2 Tax=Nocardia TaxID=1817 RepID=A0A9X2E7V1_9NOCA|nr:amino acid--tRNA ligase-related protein [Nocardia pulmonis]MCM6774465.1 hypothetical protein [Nocardia pulmonis]MCM6787469.1 hypothetical protein [Nocardia sp. CDC159]
MTTPATPPATAEHTIALTDPIRYTSDLLRKIRNYLHDNGFVEVVTPVFRQADDLTGKRATAVLGAGGFLRSMIGPALRYNLQYAPRIFEIGPCFRPERPDATHSREFTMLDLYAANEDFAFLYELAEDLIALAYPKPLPHISVAEHLNRDFGVDLTRHSPQNLADAIARRLALPATTPMHELIDTAIATHIEPLTRGTAAFLVDYPLGGNEPCARRRDGTTAIIDRFEVFIDGLEVAHGYRDETDHDAFIERATTAGLYNREQALVLDAITAGDLPTRSVGLGIGIERLCMAATGIDEIRTFQQSRCF